MFLLDEAYFGKPKNCLEIEKCIETIRKKFSTDSLILDVIQGRGLSVNTENLITSSKEWLRIGELIEEQFGFYSVNLNLIRESQPNAMTLIVSSTFDGSIQASKAAIVGKEGFKYKKEYKFCTMIMITESLLFNKDFTAGELTAIIMHEIGHNFDTSVHLHLVPLKYVLWVFYMLHSLMTFNVAGFLSSFLAFKIIIRLFVTVQNTFMHSAIYALYDTLIFLFLCIPKNILSLLLIPVGKVYFSTAEILSGLNSGAWLITLIYGYTMENFSDKFAAMHGYGPELVSGLGKLEAQSIGSEALLDQIPIVSHLYGLYLIAGSMLNTIEPHPVYAARMRSCINIIELDLKSDKTLNEKTKKQIKKDIEEIKKCNEQYLEDMNVGGSKQVYKLYNDWLLDTFRKYGDLNATLLGDANDENIDMAIERLKRNAKDNDTFF